MARPKLATMIVPALLLASPAAAFQVAAKPAPAAKSTTRAQFTAGLDQNYKKIDGNNDGSLVMSELETAQSRQVQAVDAALGKRRKEAFAKLDTDRNGSLSPAEFEAAMPNPKRNSGAVAASLTRLDTNKDGKVSLAEYRAPMLANFDRVDANKDGIITAAEQNAGRKR